MGKMFPYKRVERLSEIVSKDELIEGLENILGDVHLLIDEGYYIEVYMNPMGVSYVNPEDLLTGNVDNGYHLFRYMDKECTYEELLNIFAVGSIRNGTMTLTLIPSHEPFFGIYREKCVPISLELDSYRGCIA
jgi:hypothetical protein